MAALYGYIDHTNLTKFAYHLFYFIYMFESLFYILINQEETKNALIDDINDRKNNIVCICIQGHPHCVFELQCLMTYEVFNRFQKCTWRISNVR
jgi:hypothetical protein